MSIFFISYASFSFCWRKWSITLWWSLFVLFSVGIIISPTSYSLDTLATSRATAISILRSLRCFDKSLALNLSEVINPLCWVCCFACSLDLASSDTIHSLRWSFPSVVLLIFINIVCILGVEWVYIHYLLLKLIQTHSKMPIRI